MDRWDLRECIPSVSNIVTVTVPESVVINQRRNWYFYPRLKLIVDYNCAKVDRNTTKHIDSTKVLVRIRPGGLSIWPLGYPKCPKCAKLVLIPLERESGHKFYWFSATGDCAHTMQPLAMTFTLCIIRFYHYAQYNINKKQLNSGYVIIVTESLIWNN